MAHVNCPRCEARIPGEHHECPQCGESVEKRLSDQRLTQPRAPFLSGFRLMVAVFVVIGIILVAAVLFLGD
jgi:predicted amidophosphoribosyltransferase